MILLRRQNSDTEEIYYLGFDVREAMDIYNEVTGQKIKLRWSPVTYDKSEIPTYPSFTFNSEVSVQFNEMYQKLIHEPKYAKLIEKIENKYPKKMGSSKKEIALHELNDNIIIPEIIRRYQEENPHKKIVNKFASLKKSKIKK